MRQATYGIPDDQKLSPAEIRVIRDLSLGLTRQEIAGAHGVGTVTIYIQIHKAMKKLKATTAEQMMVKAVEQKIIGGE